MIKEFVLVIFLRDASKVAFVTLVSYLTEHRVHLIDCQMTTSHLLSFGGREISRRRFLSQLEEALKQPTLLGPWRISQGAQSGL